MNKGFTLIELLAVIVILAIILLIAYPLITNLIESIKRSIFEVSIENIVRAAEIDYMDKKITGNDATIEYEIKDSEFISTDEFDYNGKLPNEGIIIIDSNGDVELALNDDKWCAQKEIGVKKIITTELSVDGCDLISDQGVIINNGLPYLAWQDNIASLPALVVLPAENPGGSDFKYGNGTEVNPYLISTPADLAKINDYTSAHFLQINDIDMSSFGVFTAIGVGTDPSDWDNPFTGSYNGNNFSINNITTTVDGVFRHALNATIENLKLNGNFGTETYFGASQPGALIGSMFGGTVNNVHVTGRFELREDETGGLIGYLDSYDGSVVISNCSTNIVFDNEYVDSIYSVGGLIGYVNTMTNPMVISKSSANIVLEKSTSVIDAGRIGGLIGSVYSYSNNLTIDECFTTGNIYGTDTTGGFIGDVISASPILIRNSYSLVDIESEFDSGGFISYFIGSTNLLTIENIYVSSVNKAIESYNIIPSFTGTLTSSYYNYSKENIVPSNNLGSGRAEEELRNIATYDSWDFTNVWAFSKKPTIVEEELPDKAFVFGSSSWDKFTSMAFIPEGFIAAGPSGTNDYDLSHLPSNTEAHIVKYNNYGNVVWSQGLTNNGVLNRIKTFATDDGYYVTGEVYSSSGDFVGKIIGSDDIFVAKFSIDGELLWVKTYGGTADETLNNGAIMDDGIVLVGNSRSTDCSYFENNGLYDAIIIKIDFDGNVVWADNYGSTGSDYLDTVVIKNNNIYVTGSTYGDNGDLAKFSGQITPGIFFNYIIKYDSNGNVLSEKAFSSYTQIDEEEYFYNAAQANNGVVILGEEWKDSQDNMPCIILNFDETGNLLWKKTYGYDAFGWAITRAGDNFLGTVKVYGNFLGEEFTGNNLIVKFDNQGNIVDYNDFATKDFKVENIYYNNGYVYVIGRTAINEGIYSHPSPSTNNAYIYRYKY